MNKVIFMGRVCNDLELKTTPNGVSVCQFRIAVDRNYQKKGEEKVTDFFNVSAWRNNAEFISKYFSKGRMILIEGELQTRQYTDKNGNPATWYEIVADKVHFTGEKSAESGANALGYNYAPQTQTAQYEANNAQYAPAQIQAEQNPYSPNAADDYPF